MDRFIEFQKRCQVKLVLSLKSNMDRFIGVSEVFKKIYNGGLKSNMDRFIVFTIL